MCLAGTAYLHPPREKAPSVRRMRNGDIGMTKIVTWTERGASVSLLLCLGALLAATGFVAPSL